MAVNVSELGRLLTVLGQVRELLKEFAGDADLVAIRADLIAQVRAMRPVA